MTTSNPRAVAAAAPTFLTGPIVGALADKWGAEWFMASSLLFTLPWIPLMLLTGSLPGFIIFFALASEYIPMCQCPDACLVLGSYGD
jgi:hypothetical protein